MKIYCLLLDTFPYNNNLISHLKNKGFTQLHTISQCATHSTLISMFTGRSGTDLLPDTGIAYRAEEKYQKDGHINFPFKDLYIFNRLHNLGWEIKFYIPNMLLKINEKDEGSITAHVAHSDEQYKYERIAVYDNKEWTNQLCTNTILRPGILYNKYIKNEKEALHKLQQATERNQFIFAQYHHYSMAVKTKFNINKTMDETNRVLDTWNFDEKDAIFWIFSDHDNFKSFNARCQPNAFGNWSLVKDNTPDPLVIRSKYVSLQDFYPTILQRLGIGFVRMKEGVQSIENKLDTQRVFFVEDARLAIDKYKIVSFVACKFIGWKKGVARKLRSLTYCKSNGKYFSYELDLVTRKVVELDFKDVDLMLNLKKKYSKFIP